MQLKKVWLLYIQHKLVPMEGDLETAKEVLAIHDKIKLTEEEQKKFLGTNPSKEALAETAEVDLTKRQIAIISKQIDFLNRQNKIAVDRELLALIDFIADINKKDKDDEAKDAEKKKIEKKIPLTSKN